jgi:hypothetical protein
MERSTAGANPHAYHFVTRWRVRAFAERQLQNATLPG